MANCFYYKNGQKINDVQDLITNFFEENYQLKNAKIFSSDQIQNSTLNKLRSSVSSTDYENSEKTSVTEFIVKPNPGLFNKLGIITGKSDRLTPEYDLKNRVYYYIKEHLNEIEGMSDLLNVSDLKYTEELFKSIRTHSDLDDISDNKIIYLLSQIEEKISFEEKTKEFGNLLHKLIAMKTRGDEYSNILHSFISDSKNNEIIGNYSEEDWVEKINSIVNEIIEKVTEIGKPISELVIMTGKEYDNQTPVDEWSNGIKGKLDLIAVDISGHAHIFEIKISNTKYEKWDSAKKLNVDWQLAMYRQLLSLKGIDIEQTMLYVIPIWMNGFSNPNSIQVEEFGNRKVESHSGLINSGSITIKANKLIPRKVVADYDPERETKLSNQLDKLIGNQYKIETGIEDYDKKKIMEAAKKRYDKEKKWVKWNNFDDIQGLKKGYIEADTEEEFEKKIEIYVAHVKTQVNRNVSILKDAIISSLKTNSPVKTNAYDKRKDLTVNHLLKEYLNDDWDVVNDIPEAMAFGLIILKNKINGNINIISLSINQFEADSHIPDFNYGDLEFFKTFLFLNEFKDILIPGSDNIDKNQKIAQIIVYNPINSQVYAKNTFTKFEEFKKLMYINKDLSNQLKLSDKNISSITDIALYNLDSNLRKFNGSDKEMVDKVFQNFRDTDLDSIDLSSLVDIQKQLFESSEFGIYKEKLASGSVNLSDDKEVLLALLQVAIASKAQMEFNEDYQRLSNFSLGFSDLKSLFSALYTDNQSKYNKERKKIQGIVQGLVWTTPDWVASKDLRNINNIIARCNQHVREKMLKASEQIIFNTKQFYKDINYTSFSRNILGESESKHEDLWLHNSNQKVSNEFRTKNPYVLDNENSLTDSQRNYLQKMLLIINAYKFNISDSDIKKINSESLESLMTNETIREAIESGEYFRMPLIRREEVSRYKDAFTDSTKLWKDKLEIYLNELNDFVDPRELSKGDLEIIERQKLGFYEMYDVYGRQTSDFVAKSIEKHSVNYFEWNLDIIAHRIAFSKIRKNIFDKKLPIINAFIWWIKLSAGKTNEDISKQLEYISNQMKLSVFDEPIIDEEARDFTKVVSAVKSISTPLILAFKTSTLVKELVIGTFRGMSLAATQIYGKDQFNIKDLAKAYEKLLTIDNKFSEEFNLIDRLNQWYGFANMEASSISKKLQSDRRGILRGTGRYLYMCNTIPDYYNRMVIFLAKMIHDGSYEAHSLKDGIFTYDPTKDERFSYYFNNREKYKSGEDYISSKSDEKYNKQRRRYLILQQQLNKEYGENTFLEKDLVNKAYSEIERKSLKSFTDMAYGYYDKDAQSQANNTWWGITWLNFMQFWPGKMKMWFAKPISEKDREDSPMGKIVQDYKIVEDKNGKKVKKLLYFETYEDEDGVPKTRETEVNTGDPILKWEGTPYEGLYYSVIGTLKDVFTLNFDHIKDSEERNRRALFALADAVIIFLMFGLIAALLRSWISENGTEGLSGTTLLMANRINNKVVNEYNVWQSTLGAINTEPVFLSWGKKVSGDIWDSVTGDKDLMDVMTRNVGAAEVFKTN